ncbi:Laminin subunit alpha-5 [Dissostichus eleginoides]|uniref:Laminin subunit alpha-5 n=1 Tax=Dissostichus eleginoides TaxID=100907 RepID=A0AAD9CA47_DISEL|nr:Laminin subunit alpha-5 [Dissostichus eleginoides]
MAEDDVAHVNDVLSTLQDSKEEYERLAAQLDGARTPLATKVQNFASAESKIPLVEEAEKHAELLNTLAMNLTDLVAETKKGGLVDVTHAYNKIIISIKDAEEAAKMAEKAANDTMENIKDQDLSQIADSLRNHSVELKAEVENLGDELNNELKPQLKDAERRLKDAKTKQLDVMKDLELVQKNLNFTSNVSQEISEAKQAADLANTTATQINDALRPIKEKLDQWQQTYGDANASNEDINNALMEANKTVHTLGETIPLLMKKLDKLQNHSAQMPNISENISRIRQLIQQARNAASKVGVPVKFNGGAGVQVRTPHNLADLAAYTSLKFYITLPEAARARRQDNSDKQFIFYLGNKDSSKEFLGMALVGKRLLWYFNIGGETAEVLMTEEVKSNGDFNSIVLERVLQYGQMSMSSESEGDPLVTKASKEAGGDQGLLNLLTDNTVFYVGGYPKSFKPPAGLALPNFKGCIELDTLNEEVLSLYNFENVFKLNTTEEKPCGRLKPVLTQPWVNDAAYFDGTGYAEITFSEEVSRIQRFDQEVKLISHNGILLLLQKEDQFLCLVVLKGILRVFYDFTGVLVELQPKDPASDFMKISDGDIKAIIIMRPSRVVVRNTRNVLYNQEFTESIPPFAGTYYLGGVPENKMPLKLKSMFPKQGSLKGCFRNVRSPGGAHVDLKRMKSSGVSFGCNSDLLVGVCQVFLHEGHVVVRAGNSEIKTLKTYNDDNSHYISVYNNNKGMRLYMDDSIETAKENRLERIAGVVTSTEGTTFLGGSPNQSLSNLTGCISNVFIKRDADTQMVLNLFKVKENVNVPMDCPAAKKPQQIVSSQPKQSNKPKGKNRKPSGSRSRNTRESCQAELSQPEAGATQFSGSTHSFQRYDSLPSSFSNIVLKVFVRSPISLCAGFTSPWLRINSSDGLVLSAACGQRGDAVMSLSASDGHLLLEMYAGKKKISLRSRKKYNDDQWHTVFIKREGGKISLIVDGISAQSKKVPGRDRTHVTGPVYIGGSPTAPGSGGFVGCVRDLTLNEAPAGNPTYSEGTVPCFQNPLQPGAYFSGQGGHIFIDESLVLDRDLEIQLQVRPVSDSGLLLHAGTTAEMYLSVVLSQGQVTVSINSGKGEFSASFTPEEPLCNGRWHTITVVKKNNVLQLRVDAASEQSVGPKQSRSAGALETVYLGGVPDGAPVPGLPAGLPAFHGCVRLAMINQRAAMLSKPLALHGAVGTQGCPHM